MLFFGFKIKRGINKTKKEYKFKYLEINIEF